MHKTAWLLLLMASTAVAAPPVPQDVIDAVAGYRAAIPGYCIPQNAEEEDESKTGLRQLRAEAKRDFVAMRAYYNDDFIPTAPPGTKPTVRAVSPPPFCKSLEAMKLSEDKWRSAIGRLTRTLVAHGVLPQDAITGQAEK